MIRTGFGYDVHELKEGRDLTLGGVVIPYEKGSVGHSDGDVLCHAIVDAILGAASLGDIGEHFPSHDERWKGTSSLEFIRRTAEKVREKGFQILNVDGTIVLQEPSVGSHTGQMKSRVGKALGIEEDKVSIKSTTTDHLGLVGRGEGVAAMAVATLSLAP